MKLDVKEVIAKLLNKEVEKTVFTTVTGTLASSAGAVLVAYPSGYAFDNTQVVSLMIDSGTHYFRLQDANSAYTQANGIYVYNSTSAWYGKPFRLLIAKV